MLATALAEENNHDNDTAIEASKEWTNAIDTIAAISLADLLTSHGSSALEVGVEGNEDESLAHHDDLAAILRVQRQLEALGFAPSAVEQESKKRSPQHPEGAPPSKRIKTFVPDPSKTGLSNFHELCSQIGVQKKQGMSPLNYVGKRKMRSMMWPALLLQHWYPNWRLVDNYATLHDHGEIRHV